MRGVSRQPTLLMLAGLPGTGKSTLGVAIGARLGWPVLDKDVLNAVLLQAEIAHIQAGPLAYDLVLALARSLLVSQRQSLILDTAGRQPAILQQARLMTQEAAGQLKVVRLLAPHAVRQARLGQRTAGLSQWTNDDTTPEQEAAWYAHLPPDTLLLRSEPPIAELLPHVLAFVQS